MAFAYHTILEVTNFKYTLPAGARPFSELILFELEQASIKCRCARGKEYLTQFRMLTCI